MKSATDEDLIPAVRAVAAGKPFFSPAVTAVLVEDYVRRLQQRGLTDSYHLLTDREKDVLMQRRLTDDVVTLEELSERYGKLPFATLAAPAIGYARNGYQVTPIIAELWRRGADATSSACTGELGGRRSSSAWSTACRTLP